MEDLMKPQKASDCNLKKSNNMNNKLFLVCPFSCMEIYIQQKLGENVFFMSAMAAVLRFDREDISAIKHFIEREKIQEILIVGDTSCRFINGALKNEKGFGSYGELLIKNIVLKNKDALSKASSELEKQKIITKSLIINQLQEICSPDYFKSEILHKGLRIGGIITTKSRNELIELDFNNN